MRCAVALLVTAGLLYAAPVPELSPQSGRPKILENTMEVKTLSYLMRDCARCHGLYPTHTYEGHDEIYPPRFFDHNNKIRMDHLANFQKRAWLAKGVDVALRSNHLYQPRTEEGKREIRQAAEWLRRKP